MNRIGNLAELSDLLQIGPKARSTLPHQCTKSSSESEDEFDEADLFSDFVLC
jgi:hypothetical protein